MSKSPLPLVVSPEEFNAFAQQEHTDLDVRIVDLSEERNYLQGHIPGAIFLPYQSLVLGAPPVPGKLPAQQRLTEIFSYLGLQTNTHFVVCDDEGGGWAGRFIWTLDVIGHKHYSYIDGGMLAWKASNLPMESGQGSNPYSTENIPPITIDRTPAADLEFIMDGLDQSQFVVWDARSPEEFNGTKVVAAKGGHIPGAINADWLTLMDANEHYKIRSDAKSYLANLGIDGSLPIITHCQSHHRSGFTYLVGKALGFDIKGYDGSWAEWGNHPDTPVEK